jgi:hypothetical protein
VRAGKSITDPEQDVSVVTDAKGNRIISKTFQEVSWYKRNLRGPKNMFDPVKGR